MEYDKNSFLSGLSVGITLKGWSGSSVATLLTHNFRNVVMLKPPPEIVPVTDFIEKEVS